MLDDAVHGCLKDGEGTAIGHVTLEVGSVAVLSDGHVVARLHHLDSRDTSASSRGDDTANGAVDIVDEGGLIGKKTTKHWHDGILDVIDEFSWEDAQELLENVVKCGL